MSTSDIEEGGFGTKLSMSLPRPLHSLKVCVEASDSDCVGPLRRNGRSRPSGDHPYKREGVLNDSLQGESYAQMLARQVREPTSPGGLLDPQALVYREKHPLNAGRRSGHMVGRADKRYSKHDIIGPISDSISALYHKRGWISAPFYPEEHSIAKPCVSSNALCQGCGCNDRSYFVVNADRSHTSCTRCGATVAALKISTDREKNCSEAEDKTTHADRPFQSRTDRFDEPAKPTGDIRRENEQKLAGSVLSQRASAKFGIGFQQSKIHRAAAKAQEERREMSSKQQLKGVHIVQRTERLFLEIEPVHSAVKRFCRIQADRAWREAVRHARVCTSTNCDLLLEERSASLIAEAVMSVSFETLVEKGLEGVSSASILTVVEKYSATRSFKHCTLRAVCASVSTLLSGEARCSDVLDEEQVEKLKDAVLCVSEMVGMPWPGLKRTLALLDIPSFRKPLIGHEPRKIAFCLLELAQEETGASNGWDYTDFFDTREHYLELRATVKLPLVVESDIF